MTQNHRVRAGQWRFSLADQTFRASPYANTLLGYPPEAKLTFADVSSRILPDDLSVAREALQNLIRTGEPYSVEVRFTRADNGDIIHVLSMAELVRDAHGQPTEVLGVNLDITERKRDELERARLEAQLQQVQRLDALGRLAGSVAHDFNNMLSVILVHAELALRLLDPLHSTVDSLNEILHAAERSADLTRQLLAFARLQAVTPQTLDFNASIEGSLKMLRRLIGEEIEIVWTPADGVGPVKIDPVQVDQILANLCINARDAIAGVGRITIATERIHLAHGDYAVLRVTDTGAGMDEATASRIFEPFFSTKAQGKGIGLGLAMVQAIVRQYQGFVDVRSRIGEGTTFEICLPCWVGPVDVQPTHVPTPIHGCETVLLVEDERAILDIVAKLLAELGYKVLSASTPEEAMRLSMAYPSDIDILVADVVLPQMNGKQLFDKLAAQRPGLRCLFVSGYTSDVIADRGVAEDGRRFLAKPFSVITLAKNIRLLLDGG